MKEINIKGEVFQYKVVFEECGYSRTYFYKDFDLVRRRKYYLFGEVIEKLVPRFMFYVGINIEDPTHSRETVRTFVLNKLDVIRALEAREKEIERGEFI